MAKKAGAETIYLSHQQSQAVKKAIEELRKDGFIIDSVKLFESGENHGSHIEVEQTTASFLFFLGLKSAKYLS